MRKPLIILTLCTGAVFVLSRRYSEPASASAAQAAEAAKPAAKQVVAVAPAEVGPIRQDLEITGEFRPYQVVELHAKVAGYLRSINVDVGDRVRAGAPIATLDVPEMKDDVLQAAAAAEQNQAEIARLRQELLRSQASLHIAELSHQRLASVAKGEPGLIAQHELDEALARKQTAEAQTAAAKAAIIAAERRVAVSKAAEQRTKTMSDYTQITAPFAGVITKRYADKGALIQAGTASQTQAMPVVRLAQIDRLRLALPVPESAAARLKIGSPVTIHVVSLNRDFPGRVSRSTSDVQLSTRTMEVEVDVANPDGLLIPGMYATAKLTLTESRDAVIVTPQALVSRQGKRFVMIVNRDGQVEEREVKTGIETAGRIEVLSGVASGDLVVVGNRTALKTGQKVEPKVVGLG